MAYVIKRYSNRKLYDTQESRYVTLEEIEEMIRAGKEVSVVDAASGEDLTSVTLTQIILENERNHRATLPSAFLHQLIKHGETASFASGRRGQGGGRSRRVRSHGGSRSRKRNARVRPRSCARKWPRFASGCARSRSGWRNGRAR
jgi:polyhydroxyalkanoate synthesis repressor PhaR